jgi:hypothetical protein
MANSYVSRKVFHLADDVLIGKFTAQEEFSLTDFFQDLAFHGVLYPGQCSTVDSDRIKLKISLRAVEKA